jgi:hypothetical protein
MNHEGWSALQFKRPSKAGKERDVRNRRSMQCMAFILMRTLKAYDEYVETLKSQVRKRRLLP